MTMKDPIAVARRLTAEIYCLGEDDTPPDGALEAGAQLVDGVVVRIFYLFISDTEARDVNPWKRDPVSYWLDRRSELCH